MTAEQSLSEIAARIVDLRVREHRISPAWVATEAMLIIDPERAGPPLEYSAAHLYLRQVARQLLRTSFDMPDESEAKQHHLFPDLQSRYPTAAAAKSPEQVYILLEYMTKEDIAYNVARLRGEGTARLKHADRLENYGKNRKRRRKKPAA